MTRTGAESRARARAPYRPPAPVVVELTADLLARLDDRVRLVNAQTCGRPYDRADWLLRLLLDDLGLAPRIVPGGWGNVGPGADPTVDPSD